MHVHGGASEKTQRILRISLLATLAYVALTFFAGVHAHSLALISEAGHNVSDFLALLLSFVAVYFQTRPPTDQKTFGYQRAGVLAAFLNALTLVLIAVWIAIAAIHRLSEPVQVQPRLMMIVAAAGVLMNGVIAALLWTTSRDVNIRSTFIHMLGDTLSTAAVIVGGAAIQLDRSSPLSLDCRADSVEFAVHRARDAQHSLGGYAARLFIGGDPGFASGPRWG
jgi:cobalt-zinc-cadmium efflux system protein